MGTTTYEAKQDPVQWLRCYTLSIENACGNNNTKCLYFLFCVDQAPLTWLETLDKIAINEEDQEKTAFITPFGVYCYTTMSFGLKNAGASYQRAIQKCFKKQLNKNVEASVDGVVVKTRNSDTLIADLE
jgi:hypothetical protein